MGAVAGLFASCSNDDITPDQLGTPQSEFAKLRFTTAGSDPIKASTRAVWADPKGSGSLLFNWEGYTKDDSKLMVAISNGESLLGNYTSDTPSQDETPEYISYMTAEPITDDDGYSNRANFETMKHYNTEEAKQAKYVYAFAPFNEEQFDASKNRFVVEMFHPYFIQTSHKDPSFLRDMMIMCGSAEMKNGTASIEFEHIPATFRFIITNKRPMEATINGVRISRDDEGSVTSTYVAFDINNHDSQIRKLYRWPVTEICTMIYSEDATLSTNESYIAYAMALPVGANADFSFDKNAFNGKKLQFTIETSSEPANEYLSFVLDADVLAQANPNGEYNWVGGKSYTIRMSLSDVLTFEGISVSDWTDGGTIDGGVAEEVITE